VGWGFNSDRHLYHRRFVGGQDGVASCGDISNFKLGNFWIFTEAERLWEGYLGVSEKAVNGLVTKKYKSEGWGSPKGKI